ncbi:MAG: three-Cys-motif partner protein TcmP [Lacisediminihabitans sp.]
MTATEKFFEKQRQPAAVFKHALLASYVAVFGTMTSSQSAGNRVWYIDGYAGPGVYDPQPGDAEGQVGSPVLALRTARRLATFTKNPRSLHCAFIEMDKGYAAKLESVMAERAFPGFNYRVLQGSVEQHLDAVVTEVGNDPLLTFLDPFGTSLPWAQMKKTLFGRPKTAANEVLLNMNLDSLRRIGGLLGKSDTSSPGDQKTLARLDTFLGDAYWRDVFVKHYRADSPGSATVAALEVAEQFRMRVLRETGYRSFTVPIRRHIDHEPIFLMTLFFTYPVAAYKFADAASSASASWRKSINEEERRRDASLYSNTLFGDDFNVQTFEDKWKRNEELLQAEWEKLIADNIVALLVTRAQFTVLDHLQEIYGPTLGLAREKHLRAAWKSLANQGKVLAPPAGPLWSAVIRRATR